MGERGIIQIRFDELDVDELFWDELESDINTGKLKVEE